MIGLKKYAQANPEFTTQPEPVAHETMVTCLSDCQYSQNPEKSCMLKNISLSFNEQGFICGQYSPLESTMEEEFQGEEESPEENYEEEESPEPKAPEMKKEQMGLAKVKQK